MPASFREENVEQAKTPGRLVDVVEYQKIESWPKMHATIKHVAFCQLQAIPEPMPDTDMTLFVSFATECMARRFAHFEGDLVGLMVDVEFVQKWDSALRPCWVRRKMSSAIRPLAP